MLQEPDSSAYPRKEQAGDGIIPILPLSHALKFVFHSHSDRGKISVAPYNFTLGRILK